MRDFLNGLKDGLIVGFVFGPPVGLWIKAGCPSILSLF